MNRYVLEAWIENSMIFYMEFRSITSVAKAIDKFCSSQDYKIWFDVYDVLKDRSVNVKELMKIWHA